MLTVDSGVLTRVDRPLGELEDGVLQAIIKDKRLELLEARGNVCEVSSGPDSRQLHFSE